MEKGGIDQIKALKQQIEEAEMQFEDAQRHGDLERAARLKYETITNLKKQLADKEGNWPRPRRARCFTTR